MFLILFLVVVLNKFCIFWRFIKLDFLCVLLGFFLDWFVFRFFFDGDMFCVRCFLFWGVVGFLVLWGLLLCNIFGGVFLLFLLLLYCNVFWVVGEEGVFDVRCCLVMLVEGVGGVFFCCLWVLDIFLVFCVWER